MILELTYARGMRLWIDGAKAKKGWSYCEGCYNDEIDPRVIEFDDPRSKKEGIKVGDHRLLRIRTDVALNNDQNRRPEALFATFQDVAEEELEVEFEVVTCASAHPNGEPLVVTTVSNKVLKIDEITLYLMARSLDTPKDED